MLSVLLFCIAFSPRRSANAQPLSVSLPVRIDGRRYVADVAMPPGANAQHFGLIISMSSTYNVVPGLECESCNDTDLYNISASSSAKLLGTNSILHLLDGDASGLLMTEDCSLQQQNGMPWKYLNQTFLLANDSSLPNSQSTQGVLGFGMDQGSTASNSFFAGFFRKSPNQTYVSLSFALNPPRKSNTNNDGGLVHWIAPNSSFYEGSINWVQVTPPNPTGLFSLSSWAINLDSWEFKTGNSDVQSAPAVLAYVDPYYPDVYFPFNDANKIYSLVSGSTPKSDGETTTWSLPCNSKMQLSLVFQHRSYNVDESVLVYSNGSSNTCYGAIVGWSDPNINGFLLGSTFVSSVYAIFNVSQTQVNSIGFGDRIQSDKNKKTVTGLAIALSISGAIGIALAVSFFLYHRKQRLHKKERYPTSLVLSDRSKGDESSSLLVLKSGTSYPAEPGSATGASYTPQSGEEPFMSSQRSSRYEPSFTSSTDYGTRPMTAGDDLGVLSLGTVSIERNEGNLGVNVLHSYHGGDRAAPSSSSPQGQRIRQDLSISPYDVRTPSSEGQAESGLSEKQRLVSQQLEVERLVPLPQLPAPPSFASTTVAVSEEGLPGYLDGASPARRPRREKDVFDPNSS